ncbi:MAG: tyrosine--tRNA ligase [bacterium]|nr:tyrosine--tRNA ligase [bacterium]
MKLRKETIMEQILTEFERTTEEIYTLDRFKTKLTSGKQLIIKYGVDVTAPFLHIGHAVNLWMMRRLQELGHKVVFLIGDFTTKIGDPTGRMETRPSLTDEEINKNSQEFINQISHVLITNDSKVFEIKRNSEWFSKMKLSEFISLLSMITHSKLIARDMFQKRIEEQKEIYMHELIYPILQGYDSLMLNSDLTIVGSDQLFNEMMGCFLQEKFGQEPQVIITTKITPGLDGKNKQSKSLGNYIALIDTPKDKFGKVMTLPDELIIEWMKVYTTIPMEDIKKHEFDMKNQRLNPKDAKLMLAYAIVERYHGKQIAENEKNWFINTFSKKDFPQDALVVELPLGQYSFVEFLKYIQPDKSKSKLRDLIRQGAVELNSNKIFDYNYKVDIYKNVNLYVRIGKKDFYIVKDKK